MSTCDKSRVFVLLPAATPPNSGGASSSAAPSTAEGASQRLHLCAAEMIRATARHGFAGLDMATVCGWLEEQGFK